MIIAYECKCGEKFDVLYKKDTDVKKKIMCKSCGKMAKKMISLFDYKMKDGGTRNKK